MASKVKSNLSKSGSTRSIGSGSATDGKPGKIPVRAGRTARLEDTYSGPNVSAVISCLEEHLLAVEDRDELLPSQVISDTEKCLIVLSTNIVTDTKRSESWKSIISLLTVAEHHPQLIYQLKKCPALKHYIPQLMQRASPSIDSQNLARIFPEFTTDSAKEARAPVWKAPTEARSPRKQAASRTVTSAARERQLSEVCHVKAKETLEGDLKRIQQLKNYEPPPVTWRDVRRSMPYAILDTIPPGRTGLQSDEVAQLSALAGDLSEEESSNYEQKKLKSQAEEIQEIFNITSSLPKEEIKRAKRQLSVAKSSPTVKRSTEVPPSGKQLASDFLHGRLDGSIVSVYLHKTQTYHYRPYDLHPVPDDKAGSEFFIMSRDSVVSYSADGSNDIDYLMDWYREAVLFDLATEIPFFKYHLLRKAFSRWRKLHRQAQFEKRCISFQSMLLQASPQLLHVLQGIHMLVNEIEDVCITSLDPLKCYALEEFRADLKQSVVESCVVMRNFYQQCKNIITLLKERLDRRVKSLTEQRAERPYLSHMPMAATRKVFKSIDRNLQTAVDSLGNVSRLVGLVNQMVIGKIRTVARLNMTDYVDTLLERQNAGQSALIKAKFGFSADGRPVLSPSLDEIQDTLLQPLKDTLTAISPLPSSAKSVSQLPESHGVAASGDMSESDGKAEPNDSTSPSRLSPLASAYLHSRLSADNAYEEYAGLVANIFEKIREELAGFQDKYDWLPAVYKETREWNVDKLGEVLGSDADTCASFIKRVEKWKAYVEAFPHEITIGRNLLRIDSKSLATDVLPVADQMRSEIVGGMENIVILLSGQLIKQFNELIMPLLDKKSYVEGFALFAADVKKAKLHKDSLRANKERLVAFHDAWRKIRGATYTFDDDSMKSFSICSGLIEQVLAGWQAYIFHLHDADDFVRTQAPRTEDSLCLSIEAIEDDINQLFMLISSGPYIDPQSPSSSTLNKCIEIRTEFKALHGQLLGIIKWKETVSGVSHDMAHVQKVQAGIAGRTALWELVCHSNRIQEEWRAIGVKKIQTGKLIDQVTQWQKAGDRLAPDLPDGDSVLLSWQANLQKWQDMLEVMQFLFTPPFKSRHWKSLYSHLNQPFDTQWHFSLGDLVDLDLIKHRHVVTMVTNSANAEYALEQLLEKLRNVWEKREFRLAKHTVKKVSVLTHDDESTPASRYPGMKRPVSSTSSDVYPCQEFEIITGLDGLREGLQDHTVLLQSMLQSPHLLDLKSQAEWWITALEQLDDIIGIWSVCQSNWVHLCTVFSSTAIASHLPGAARKNYDLHVEVQRFVSSVERNPKVLAIFEESIRKKDGSLSGETLRKFLDNCMAGQEELIKTLEQFFQVLRSHCPRLYFVDDSTILALMSGASHPPSLVPYVRVCFPELRSVVLTDTAQSPEVTAALEMDGLPWQVYGVGGDGGEVLRLLPPLLTSRHVQSWLTSLGMAMNHALAVECHHCVEALATMEPYSWVLGPGPDSGHRETATTGAGSKADSTIAWLNWCESWQMQCLLAAFSVCQTKAVRKALEDIENGIKNDLQDAKQDLAELLKKLTTLAQGSLSLSGGSPLLYLKMSMLIQHILQYRDIMDGLAEDSPPGPQSYSWLQHLHFKIEPFPVTSNQRLYRQSSPGEGSARDWYTSVPSTISCSHLGNRVPYGYEYCSPATRQVLSPVTSRCMLTILHAMQGMHPALLFSTGQSGKSATIQELAMTLARSLVMVDCSQPLTPGGIKRYLTGAIQCGTLLCLESLHSLPVDILVMVGDMLSQLSSACSVLAGQTTVQPGLESLSKHARICNRRSSIAGGITLKQVKPEVVSENQAYLSQQRHPSVLPTGLMQRSNSMDELANRPVSENTSAINLRSASAAYHAGQLPTLGRLVFDGDVMTASSGFGTILTWSGTDYCSKLPASFQLCTRPICMQLPDSGTIADIRLCSAGFVHHGLLAIALKNTLKQIYDGGYLTCNTVSQVSMLNRILTNCVKLQQLKLSSEDALGTDDTAVSSLSSEQGIVCKSLQSCVVPLLKDQDVALLKELSCRWIEWSKQDDDHPLSSTDIARAKEQRSLLSEINSCLTEEGLSACDGKMVDKIMQLYDLLRHCRSVIVLGSAGSGKTKLIHILERSLNIILSKHQKADPSQLSRLLTPADDFQRRSSRAYSRLGLNDGTNQDRLISLKTLFFEAVSKKHLLGSSADNSVKHGGLLAKMLESCHCTAHREDGALDMHSGVADVGSSWLVLDGPLASQSLDILASLLESWKCLFVENGSSMYTNDSSRLLLECDDITHSSPGAVGEAGLLVVEDSMLTWSVMLDTWIKRMESIFALPSSSVQFLSTHLEHLLPKTLAAAHRLRDQSRLCMRGSKDVLQRQNVLQTLDILHSLLHCFLGRDSSHFDVSTKASTAVSSTVDMGSSVLGSVASSVGTVNKGLDVTDDILSHCVAYSLIWGTASTLDVRYHQAFSAMILGIFKQSSLAVNVPATGCAMDYRLDNNGTSFILLSDSAYELSSTAPCSYLPIPEVIRYAVLIDYLASAQHPVLLTGEAGVGKTSLMNYAVAARHPHHRYPLSAVMEAQDVQKALEERHAQLQRPYKLQLSRKIAGAGRRKRHVVFVDDVHLVKPENQTQVYEMLRQLLATGSVFQEGRQVLKQMPELQLVASLDIACSQQLPNRLFRQWTQVHMAGLSDDAIFRSLAPRISNWLEEFPAYSVGNTPALTESLVRATLRIKSYIDQAVLADASQPHCLFNQRQIFQAIEGLQLVTPSVRPRHFRRQAPAAVWRNDRQAGGASNAAQGRRRGRGPAAGGMAINEDAVAITPPMLRTVIRLWSHEISCVYMDALNTSAKQDWFSNVLQQTVLTMFCGAKVQEDGSLSGQRNDAKMMSRSDVPSSLSRSHSTARRFARTDSRSSASGSQSRKKTTASRRGSRKASGSLRRGSSKGGSSVEAPDDPEDEFEAALLAAAKASDANVAGGLVCVTQDSIMRRGEDIARLAFTSHLVPGEEVCRNVTNKKSTYVECGSGELEQALQYILSSYNERCDPDQKLDVVFFPKFIDHLVKQCRLLALHHHHSILIGPQGCGRKTVLRIASCATGHELLEVSPPLQGAVENIDDQHSFYLNHAFSMLRHAMELGGVQQKPVLVAVHGRWNIPVWTAIATFMKEGICPGLYSTAELTALAFRRSPAAEKAATGSGQGQYRLDKVAKAIDDLMKDVLKNVHVAVCLPDDRRELCLLRASVPQLLQGNVGLQWYNAWDEVDCSEVASQILERSVQAFNKFSSLTSLSVHSVGRVMAAIHCDMKDQLKELPFRQKRISADLFLEVPSVFCDILKKLVEKHVERMEEVQVGLDSLERLTQAANDLKAESETVGSVLDKSRRELNKMEGRIAKDKRFYYESLDRCKAEESEIEAQLEPLEKLRAEAQAEFDKVTPLYNSALVAVQSLNKKDMSELKSYGSPPDTVRLVAKAICALLGVEETWEEAKRQVLLEDFPEKLFCFDKDNISNATLRRVHYYTSLPNFTPEAAAASSVAAKSFCLWVLAIEKYSQVYKSLQPRRERLEKTQQRLLDAQKKLSEKRKTATDFRVQIKKKVTHYQECARNTADMEQSIVELEERAVVANNTASRLQDDLEEWKQEMAELQRLMSTAPGDALVCAAAACYSVLAPTERFDKSVEKWCKLCRDAGVTVREKFSLATVLSSAAKLSEWQVRGMARYSQAINTNLMIHSIGRNMRTMWPVVFDQEHQVLSWLRSTSEATSLTPTSQDCPTFGVEDSRAGCADKSQTPTPTASDVSVDCSASVEYRQVSIVKATDVHVLDKVVAELSKGNILVIDGVGRALHRQDIQQLLVKRISIVNGLEYLLIGDRRVRYSDGLTVVFLLQESIEVLGNAIEDPDLIGSACQISGCFVDASLTKHGVSSCLGEHVLQSFKPEVDRHGRDGEMTIASTRDRLEYAKNNLLRYIQSLEGADLLRNQEVIEVQSMTAQKRHVIEEELIALQSTDSYVYDSLPLVKPITTRAAVVYMAIQHFVKYYTHYSIAFATYQQWFLDYMQSVWEELERNSHGIETHHITEPFVNGLTRTLGLKFCALVSPAQRQVLLLFFAMSVKRELSSTSDPEWCALTQELVCAKTEVPGGRPAWLREAAWERCAALSSIPCFSGLCKSIVQDEVKWSEYFKSPPTLVDPPSLNHAQLTSFQVVLLWKAINPDQVAHLLRDLTAAHLGPLWQDSSTPTGFVHINKELTAHRPIVVLYDESCGLCNVMEELHHAQVNAATKHHSPAVHSVTLTSPLQQQNAKQVLQEARCMGDWVVFTDVWCKGAKWLNSVIETLDELLSSQSASTTHTGSKLHHSFRVIIPVPNKSSVIGTLPSYLKMQALTATVEIQSNAKLVFTEMLQRAERALEYGKKAGSAEAARKSVASLALLHSQIAWRTLCSDRLFMPNLLWGAPLHHAIKQAVMFAGKLKHGNDVCCFLADFIYALPLLTGDQHNAVSSLCQLYWKIMCGDIRVVVNSENIQFVDAGRQGDVPDVDVLLSGPLAALAHVEDRSLGIQQSKMVLNEVKTVSRQTANLARFPSSSQLVQAQQLLEQLSRDLPHTLSSTCLEKLPHWLLAECHSYNTCLGDVISHDMKGLHYVLRGDKPWVKGSFELQRSLLCGEVPGTWRRRFPQATAHRLHDWVVIIGEIHRELQKLLLLFEERIDATVHYSDCLNVEGGIRLGLLFHPVSVFSWLEMKVRDAMSMPAFQDFFWSVAAKATVDPSMGSPLSLIALSGVETEGGTWSAASNRLQDSIDSGGTQQSSLVFQLHLQSNTKEIDECKMFCPVLQRRWSDTDQRICREQVATVRVSVYKQHTWQLVLRSRNACFLV